MEDLLKIPEINSDTSDDNLPEFIDEINDPNYSSVKDLTSSHTTKEKDLIPPPKNTKNKSKKTILYNVLKDEDFISATNNIPEPDGENVLANILNYPETNNSLN